MNSLFRCLRTIVPRVTPLVSEIGTKRAPILQRLQFAARFASTKVDGIRNVAIIAHVDHGKTTLVDTLLRQSGTMASIAQGARVMDSNALEKERGITILAKVTAVNWANKRVNIVDTPGHADFGGEVERILSMVDGVVLLVDATEGPMPQTKFVLSKALKQKLRPIVVLNKSDRDTARHSEVEGEIFDLFCALECTEEQLDFPVLYASAKEGWAVRNLTDKRETMGPLLDTIVDKVPAPQADPDAPFSMLVTTVERDHYLGRILTGRIYSGALTTNDKVHSLKREESTKLEEGRILKIMQRSGTEKYTVDRGIAGDIISVSGMTHASVGDTIANIEVLTALPSPAIDPPTIAMHFGPNDSPLAGTEGTQLTSSLIGDRLKAEAETNVALQVTQVGEFYEVRGRGELQLGILIENMRREGFELSVSPPSVVYRQGEGGERLEPIEEVMVDVDAEFMGIVIEKLSQRKAELLDTKDVAGKTRLRFLCPARGLIGFKSEFSTETRGTGIMHHVFHSYQPFKGHMNQTRKGVLVSMADGASTHYALQNLEDRGTMFITPGVKVYPGMIVGEHTRDNDLDVNASRPKKLTNVRATATDMGAIPLSPPRIFKLEESIAYVKDGELVEVTPKSIRLRKGEVDISKRRVNDRNARK